jgi:steroid delta-isomerase-like uncharacterized protein
MSKEEKKAVIRLWLEARNANDVDAAVALWADDWKERITRAFNNFSEAFPDIHITPEELIAEGDRVAVSWTFTGTHLGTYREIPPTGKRVEWKGIDLYTVGDGRITSLVRGADSLSLLKQLGVTISR